MTPTLQAAIERHKRFRQHIATKAAELELRRQPPPAASEPDPPAVVLLAPDITNCLPFWFSIVDSTGLPRPAIRLIQKVTAAHFGVTVTDLISARRSADVVKPRQIAMFIAKEMTLRSLPEIGRRFGGRDHTTALFSIRKVRGLVASDAQMRSDVEAIMLEVRSQM